jgi:hypothetical protein
MKLKKWTYLSEILKEVVQYLSYQKMTKLKGSNYQCFLLCYGIQSSVYTTYLIASIIFSKLSSIVLRKGTSGYKPRGSRIITLTPVS